jgi:hypothetical protein
VSAPARLIVQPHAPPVASFLWAPATPRAGEVTSLVSTASDASSPIVSYAWDVQGKGVFAPGGSSITTVLPSPGPHNVSLRVTAADGLSTTVTKTIVAGGFAMISPLPIVRIAGVETSTGARITLLSVQAPVGATIAVSCRGRGCSAKPQVVGVAAAHAHAGIAVVVFRRFERRYAGGSVLWIRVFVRGRLGKYTSFRIRTRKLPIRADACIDPLTDHTIRCPRP